MDFALLAISILVIQAFAEAQEREGEAAHKDRPGDVRTEESHREHEVIKTERRDRTRHAVVVSEKPPVLRKEIRGLAPSSRHVWIAGYWSWKRRWIWVPGQWELPPHGRTPWVDGHWVAISGGWSWVEGKWGRYTHPSGSLERHESVSSR